VSKERFIKIIRDLQNYKWDKPQNLLFKFDTTVKAQTHNATILKEFDFDLNAAILAQTNSQVMFGSEFKEPYLLEDFLKDHPNWPQLKSILQSGTEFPLEPLSHDERLQDLEYHQTRGNHKSAWKNSTVLDELIETYIRHSFVLPLPADTYKFHKCLNCTPGMPRTRDHKCTRRTYTQISHDT
jgi:hypothetical protein